MAVVVVVMMVLWNKSLVALGQGRAQPPHTEAALPAEPLRQGRALC